MSSLSFLVVHIAEHICRCVWREDYFFLSGFTSWRKNSLTLLGGLLQWSPTFLVAQLNFKLICVKPDKWHLAEQGIHPITHILHLHFFMSKVLLLCDRNSWNHHTDTTKQNKSCRQQLIQGHRGPVVLFAVKLSINFFFRKGWQAEKKCMLVTCYLIVC